MKDLRIWIGVALFIFIGLLVSDAIVEGLLKLLSFLPGDWPTILAIAVLVIGIAGVIVLIVIFALSLIERIKLHFSLKYKYEPPKRTPSSAFHSPEDAAAEGPEVDNRIGRRWSTDPLIEYINEDSRILEISCCTGEWNQYDIVLDIPPFTWEDMMDMVDYISREDMCDVFQLTAGTIQDGEQIVTIEYYAHKGKLSEMPILKEEKELLGIAGISDCLGKVKIIPVRGTNTVQIFSHASELIVGKYVETIIRRNFHTPLSMMTGKPRRAQ